MKLHKNNSYEYFYYQNKQYTNRFVAFNPPASFNSELVQCSSPTLQLIERAELLFSLTLFVVKLSCMKA